MRRSQLRRLRIKSSHIQELSMTPLIDVALTLLIIFMVTTPMMNNIIKVELPSSHIDEGGQSFTQQELMVYIDASGKMYLNSKVYSLDDLLKQLKKIVKKDSEEIVFVKADQAVSYGKVIDLVDTIKIAGGVKYVALATKRAF